MKKTNNSFKKSEVKSNLLKIQLFFNLFNHLYTTDENFKNDFESKAKSYIDSLSDNEKRKYNGLF